MILEKKQKIWASGAVGIAVAVVLGIVSLDKQHEFFAALILSGFVITIAVFFLYQPRHTNAKAAYFQSLTLIHDTMDVLAVHTDASGRLMNVNKKAAREIGPLRDMSIQDYVSEVFPDAGTLIADLMSASILSNRAHERTTTGQTRVHIRAYPLRFGFQLWILHKLAPTQVIQNAFMHNRLPMFQCDRDGQVLMANDAIEKKLGFTPTRLDQIFYSGGQSNSPVRLMKSVDGVQSVQLFEVEKSQDYSMMLVIPQVLASKMLSSWSSLEDLPVAILKLDPLGGVAGSNKLAAQLLGQEDLIGLNLADLVEGLGRSVVDWMDDHITGRTLSRPEIVMSRQSEGDKYLQVTLDTVQDHGEIFVIAVLNDATELKTLEAQFVQSQKMQAIGQLAGGVAHDFNNLLTAISGHCDLLLLRHDAQDQDYADLQQIVQNANRAASLVGQLLAFSRKQNLKPEVVDLREILADLTYLLNRLVGDNVQLTQNIGNDIGYTRADKRQLEQVIMNLVVNARDALGTKGGTIQIKTERLVIEKSFSRDRATVPAGKYIVVRVCDDGVGIAPDFKSKIFEPFVTTKRTGEGTGLGLSMVYGIIKQSGGFVFVDSILGEGSEFSLYLPACEAPVEVIEATPATPKPKPAQPSGGVVLLVEDEAPVRTFASRALQLKGFKVLEADSAEAALSTLEDQDLHIDVFVSDVIMPGMDGPTWVEKALVKRPDAKVVFVSGYAEESFSQQQARIPQSVFLSKPFSLADLTNKVQAQLEA